MRSMQRMQKVARTPQTPQQTQLIATLHFQESHVMMQSLIMQDIQQFYG